MLDSLSNHRLPERDVVLVGAGHTHLHVVRMWKMSPLPGIRLTLISPCERATYSGMLPGTLAGIYQPEEMEVDLVRLVAASGARLIVDEVTGIDVPERRVLFRERAPIRFDVASIGVGSVPAGHAQWRAEPSVIAIKPMATFQRRLDERLEALRLRQIGTPQRPLKIVVVGGGAAGVEIALCLDARLCRDLVPHHVTLIDAGPEILRGYVERARRYVLSELGQRGIACRTGIRITQIADGFIADADGNQSQADVVIWATGAAPSALVCGIDLPKADDGFLAIRPTLQSVADVPIFAVGDSGSFIHQRVAKAGVFAVREGPVLWTNIGRMVRGERLIEYSPQRRFLRLLADGRGRAIMDFRGFAAHGHWVWKWKDRIDRRFMQMHRDDRPMPRPSGVAMPTTRPLIKCLGCGGKAGGNVLRLAFDRLKATYPQWQHHKALQGPADAAELSGADRMVDLVTVDFFEAFMDDAWIVGRIAALNACSDLWAMGGAPRGALASITLPPGHEGAQAETLFQTLAGALHEFSAAGVELLGGHTIEGASLAVGFTVLGALDGQRPLRKSGLAVGDALVLTKPLGTGVLLAGMMSGQMRASWRPVLLDSMLSSNRLSSAAARRHGAAAMTDVTGFGLAGHLSEMLSASGTSATLRIDSIPLLDGAAELWRNGLRSTLDPANRQLTSDVLTCDEVVSNRAEFAALFDPQTSGGLLIGINQAAAPGLVEELRREGLRAIQIGEVTANGAASGHSAIRVE